MNLNAASSVLIANAAGIMTGLAGEAARAAGPDIRMEAGVIAEVGRLRPRPGEERIDATDCIVYPAWVCTHHHLFQTLMKGVPAGMNSALQHWLGSVPWPYRRHLDAEALETAALVGMAELLLSGCATVADHHFAYYPDMPYDGAAVLFDAAGRLGMRFVLCRGGSTRPLPGFDAHAWPFLAPETFDAIAADVERLARRYHDPSPHSFRRVAVAPTVPLFRMSAVEMVDLARIARRLGLRLHTHVSEDIGFVRHFEEQLGRRPVQFLAEHEWVGPDVWFAHLCHLDDAEIALLARSGTGMAHCPGSNCRLGSGIARAPDLAAAGGAVSLAVDGTASNETGDMVSEAHLALFLHRAARGAGHPEGGASAVTVEDVVHWGTAGGGRVLGLQTGAIAPGHAADVALYELDDPRYFGFHDQLVAPVLAGGRPRLRRLLCGGRTVVADGRIPGLDMAALQERARRAVQRLAGRSPKEAA